MERARNVSSPATPRTVISWAPSRPAGRTHDTRTWDWSVTAAASNASATAARFSAATTEPPPALAKALSTSPFASGLLNATTSARTLALSSASTAARRPCERRPLPLQCGDGVAAVAEQDDAALALGAERRHGILDAGVERSLALGPQGVDGPLHLGPVGGGLDVDTDVVAKETTPTFTSSGTSARKSLTAVRTVAIPEAFIEPLVSMTSIVVRCAVDGLTVTSVVFPPRVPETDSGSTAAASSVRRMVPAAPPCRWAAGR